MIDFCQKKITNNVVQLILRYIFFFMQMDHNDTVLNWDNKCIINLNRCNWSSHYVSFMIVFVHLQINNLRFSVKFNCLSLNPHTKQHDS